MANQLSQTLTQQSQHGCFDGTVGIYSHQSQQCQCTMTFAVYVPPQAKSQPVPVLYYLSGLTCTEQNFITKAGAQRYAAHHGLMLVAPDTSPRGDGVPDEDSWDFGSGAGFYVDATVAPWVKNYRMYSYVTEELPALIHASFSVDPSRQGIFGHSMGGHGALVCGLRNLINISPSQPLPPLLPRANAPGDKKHWKSIWAQMNQPGRLTMLAS